jgi:hypothetical protein
LASWYGKKSPLRCNSRLLTISKPPLFWVSVALGVAQTELFYSKIDPITTMNFYRKAVLEDVCGLIQGEIKKLNEKPGS